MGRSFKHVLMKYKYVISIVVFAVLIGFVGDNSLLKRLSQKQEIKDLKTQISNQKKIYERDKVELEKINNNPEAVKRVAHEKYYMKTEDEDIYVIENVND